MRIPFTPDQLAALKLAATMTSMSPEEFCLRSITQSVEIVLDSSTDEEQPVHTLATPITQTDGAGPLFKGFN